MVRLKDGLGKQMRILPICDILVQNATLLLISSSEEADSSRSF